MDQSVVKLSRGGYIVNTSSGPIQFGIPPETIKDSILLKTGVPRIYVLPRYLFSVERALSLADIEFPIYYNFFLRRQAITVVCEEEQKDRMRNILKETLFPEVPKQTVDSKFRSSEKKIEFPDFNKELEYFMHPPYLNRRYEWDDLIDFKIIGNGRSVKIGNVTIDLEKERNQFQIYDSNEKIAEIPWCLPVVAPRIQTVERSKTFIPPLFGVSVLGRSDGFDPTAPTCGFVFWIDQRGIMVDPPVDSTLKLKNSNVSPKLINDVILTHVHSDHDAGVLQKIFEEGKVNLYTTQHIFESFLCKAEHLTNYSKDELQTLIHFKPIRIGMPITILGATFEFRYSLHPVPTIQMGIYFQNESLFYTSDHAYDPDLWKTLYEKGILTKSRYKSLKKTPWDHTMILHEAGIPPTHTPIQNLINLDDEIKSRVYVVHVGKQNFPEGCGLKLAPDSIENYLSIPVKTPRFHEGSQVLRTLSKIDFMSDFPVSKLIDILPSLKRKNFEAGEVIMRQNEVGNEFHIIVYGKVEIIRDNKNLITYGQNDYYGEMATISGEPRSADVLAKTDVEVLAINEKIFLAFIEGTHVVEYLKKLERTRRLDSCALLESSPVFGFLTPTQITQMQAMMSYVSYSKESVLIESGHTFSKGFIISKGAVKLIRDDIVTYRLGIGGFIGEIDLVLENRKQHYFEAIAETGAHLYQVESQPLKRFISNHSGVRVRLLHYAKYSSQALHFIQNEDISEQEMKFRYGAPHSKIVS
ncbi:MAG: hypothetical protein B6244_04800 [Candidatus Cloacimonetes bacterium 4572_55]|nr:MAG: hypothetical protein B6244_04800 [Candidatus Cloacimonetes bacterium 4572_55]